MSSTASLLLTGGSALTTAIGQQQQAGAVLAQGEYNNRIAQWNARLDDIQANDAAQRGAQAVDRRNMQTAQQVGSQRAGIAAQGIDASSGSAAAIQQDTTQLGYLDALTISNNAAREVFGYTTQGAMDRLSGRAALLGARNTAQTYRNASYTTALTGALNTARQYQQYGGTFAWPGSSTPRGTPANDPMPTGRSYG